MDECVHRRCGSGVTGERENSQKWSVLWWQRVVEVVAVMVINCERRMTMSELSATAVRQTVVVDEQENGLSECQTAEDSDQQSEPSGRL
jgi:hypothetical protein